MYRFLDSLEASYRLWQFKFNKFYIWKSDKKVDQVKYRKFWSRWTHYFCEQMTKNQPVQHVFLNFIITFFVLY